MDKGFPAGFGVLGLSLCAAGVYGVASHSVSRRTFEFGVRMALGAGAADIWALAIGKTLAFAALGLTLGLASSLAATRSLESFLYGVAPTDASILLGASALLFLCSFAAALLPARRATRVDPAAVLGWE